MHRNDRPRTIGYCSLDAFDIDAPTVAAHVHHHGLRPRRDHGIARRYKGQVRNNDLIAWPNSKNLERQMQADSPIGYRHRISRSAKAREFFLKFIDVMAKRRNPSRLYRVRDIFG